MVNPKRKNREVRNGVKEGLGHRDAPIWRNRSWGFFECGRNYITDLFPHSASSLTCWAPSFSASPFILYQHSLSYLQTENKSTSIIKKNSHELYRVFIKYCDTKNYQPIGVTVHSHYVESFEGLFQRYRRGRRYSKLWKNTIFSEHSVPNIDELLHCPTRYVYMKGLIFCCLFSSQPSIDLRYFQEDNIPCN